MKSPTKWYLRSGMGFLALVLILIGIFSAILTLPEAPALSPLLFVLVGGPGIFIGCKQNSKGVFLVSLIIASVAYFFYAMLLGPSTHNALPNDFGSRVFPVICLVSLPFALFAALFERSKTPERRRFGHVLLRVFLWFLICLLIAVPFTLGGMLDYNHRADKSLPEVISMKIVSKEEPENLGLTVWLVAPDTGLSFSVHYLPADFYMSHDVGDWVNATVHKGALGYPWLERYSD